MQMKDVLGLEAPPGLHGKERVIKATEDRVPLDQQGRWMYLDKRRSINSLVTTTWFNFVGS